MDPVDILIGVDIGQKRDPTAIAVTELTPNELRTETIYQTRFLERLPLGTPYPQVAERLAEIVQNTRQAVRRSQVERYGLGSAECRITTYVDATGVGKPVVDLLRNAGVPVTEVYFTHGDRRKEEDGRVTMGKAWLVSRLQALLQTQRLRFPKGHTEADALMRELLDYEIRVDERANDRYGAFKVGTHDDLVTAVGLASQEPRAVTGPLRSGLLYASLQRHMGLR